MKEGFLKAFFRNHKKLLAWLGADLLLLVLFWLVRGNRTWMNALAAHGTTPLRQALGRLCYRVDFSVAEGLCVLAAAAAAAYLLRLAVVLVRDRAHRGRRAVSGLLGAACGILTVYLGFCLMWGVDYCTDSFQDRSGITAQPVAAEDLRSVTAYFAGRLAETAGQVERDENGCFAVSREEILADSPRVYDALEAQFPFLAFDDTGVKPVHFSRVMSLLDFTGIYCPFTGEANVNMDSPACMLPSTAAHEMAHQRSISSEQECNFLAVLASTASGLPAYAYSGWLLGYIHLGNALYRADPDAWREIREALPREVLADLADNNAYWAQFRESVVQQVSNTVYDGFLKSYGEEQGLQSYGTVVDLLVVYYREAAAASNP